MNSHGRLWLSTETGAPWEHRGLLVPVPQHRASYSRAVTERIWLSLFVADTVIEDKSGVLSVIRLIDQATVNIGGVVGVDGQTPAPIELAEIAELRKSIAPPVTTNVVLLGRLLRGEPQTAELSIRLRAPSGKLVGTGATNTVTFTPERHLQVIAPIQFPATESGRYVFEATLNKRIQACTLLDVNVVWTGEAEEPLTESD